MKKLFLVSLFLFFHFSIFLFGQNTAGFSVYLIGDAGEDTVPGSSLLRLKDELLAHPNSAVVFLGDNAYPSGIKKDDRNSQLHIGSQLQILKEYKGEVYFIPGNHDWAAQGRSGMKRLKNEQEYVEAYLKKNTIVANKSEATFLPENGLPGPATVMLNDHVRLVIIDTQWFLHLYKKARLPDGQGKEGTKKNTRELFYARLDSILEVAKKNNEQVIVTAHHPMYTNGQHARHLQPWRFLVNYTPFRLFGVFGLTRVLSQDLDQPVYKKMRKRLLSIFDKYDNIIYVSGHDHNLQCFKEGNTRYVVSGSGSKLSLLRSKKRFDSLYQKDDATGFFELKYTTNEKGDLIVYKEGEGPVLIEGMTGK